MYLVMRVIVFFMIVWSDVSANVRFPHEATKRAEVSGHSNQVKTLYQSRPPHVQPHHQPSKDHEGHTESATSMPDVGRLPPADVNKVFRPTSTIQTPTTAASGEAGVDSKPVITQPPQDGSNVPHYTTPVSMHSGGGDKLLENPSIETGPHLSLQSSDRESIRKPTPAVSTQNYAHGDSQAHTNPQRLKPISHAAPSTTSHCPNPPPDCRCEIHGDVEKHSRPGTVSDHVDCYHYDSPSDGLYYDPPKPETSHSSFISSAQVHMAPQPVVNSFASTHNKAPYPPSKQPDGPYPPPHGAYYHAPTHHDSHGNPPPPHYHHHGDYPAGHHGTTHYSVQSFPKYGHGYAHGASQDSPHTSNYGGHASPHSGSHGFAPGASHGSAQAGGRPSAPAVHHNLGPHQASHHPAYEPHSGHGHGSEFHRYVPAPPQQQVPPRPPCGDSRAGHHAAKDCEGSFRPDASQTEPPAHFTFHGYH